MYLPSFGLQRPRSLAEALNLRAGDPDSVWYAGGTELVAVMKLGLATPSTLIDIKAVPELRALEVTPARVRIGATVTHRTLERDRSLRTVLPILAELERWVANVRVRNVGSLGGNLAFAEPHSDPAPLLMALDARVELAGATGERELLLEDFLRGPFETALEHDELLRAIVVDGPSAVVGAAIGRRAFRERPSASVVVVQHRDGARIAVGSAGPVARRARAAEAMMDERRDDPGSLRADARSIGEAVAAIAGAYDEPGASAEFKEHLVAVLTERAIHRMLDPDADRSAAIV
jgi:aerobic carbon-monoxide dehydrogenase medium subunit